MATRSLLEIFIIMRNNALQNRHMYSDRVGNIKYFKIYYTNIVINISE